LGVWEAFFPPAQTLFVPGLVPGPGMHLFGLRHACSDDVDRRPGDAHCADGEQELPGLEDEVHGGPDAAAATSIAPGLKSGLSSASMGRRTRSRKPRPQWQLQLGRVF
jgi:hypothetical protein